MAKRIIYTPDSVVKYPRQMVRDMVCDLIAARELAWQLAVRDIRAQYRQAFLGLLWAFILPFAHTFTWVFLSSTGIVGVKDTALPYPVYVFTGTMIWSIFMDAVNAPLQQTIAAKHMLAKINFPYEALVLSGIYQTIFNGVIKIGMLIAALLLTGIYPTVYLFYFPLGIISIIITGSVLGLMLTPLGFLYSDVGKSLPLLLQFLMYLTPVVFPMPTSGWAATIYKFNPMTPLILTTRDWLTANPTAHVGGFAVVTLLVSIMFFIFWIIYRSAMPILIERINL